MDDAYYSLDQLLAENQKIPCIFNIAVPGMGYLEGTNERDIQPYTPIEIPFWLASILSQQDNPEDESQNYLTIQIPKAFNLQIRNALSASTKNVNLKNLAANSGGGWYESGMALLDMYVFALLFSSLLLSFFQRKKVVHDSLFGKQD
ncbi:DNA replication protein [Puccinia graminis f. sp. tritici]|uniref:DNA replication complex GINS protein PSF3 n=1 Tax=Puccinia graminis f. sp. tritici TaxID=56615 RepID=A0A5B0RDP2_PUCGR|nr:DNA replication protein [Puccinia graminis f. sp. tritici]